MSGQTNAEVDRVMDAMPYIFYSSFESINVWMLWDFEEMLFRLA